MAYIATIALLGLTLEMAAVAGETTEVVLLSYSSRRQDFEWRITEGRLRADRVWDITKKEAPLRPGKAFKIAERWLHKRHPSAELAKMEIQSLGIRNANLAGHYFYVVEFLTGAFDTMAVVILMDGTVVEPVPVLRRKVESR